MVEVEVLQKEPFAQAVRELEQLLEQPHRAFLLGAGCSRCAGLPLTIELTAKVSERLVHDEKAAALMDALAKQFAGAKSATIEDYLSELVDLHALAERREQTGASCRSIPYAGRDYCASDLRDIILKIKDAIHDVFTSSQVDPGVHRKFVHAIHHTLRQGKEGTDRPVDYFVLNYDTLVEDALALEQVTYADGFDGGATGWWHADGYAGSKIAARVIKIHGSVDWSLFKGETLPRRISPRLALDDIDEKVMIWPASTKYRETQRDPYAQMLAMMRESLRPQRNTQVVLAVCGYRFGDSHINLELDAALRESGERLTVLVFTEEPEPGGAVAAWLKDTTIAEQVVVFARRGYFRGERLEKSEEDLPWWKFEVLTAILGGTR